MIIKIPLYFQKPHHPRIRVFFHLQSYYSPTSSGLELAFQILKKVRFYIFTLFQREIAIAIDPEKVNTSNFNVTKQMVDIMTNDILYWHKLNQIVCDNLIKTGQVMWHLYK